MIFIPTKSIRSLCIRQCFGYMSGCGWPHRRSIKRYSKALSICLTSLSFSHDFVSSLRLPETRPFLCIQFSELKRAETNDFTLMSSVQHLRNISRDLGLVWRIFTTEAGQNYFEFKGVYYKRSCDSIQVLYWIRAYEFSLSFRCNCYKKKRNCCTKNNVVLIF